MLGGVAGRLVDLDALLTGFVFDELSPLHPSLDVFPAVPEGVDWALGGSLLVVISSGGGPSRDVVVQDATFTVEALAPSRVAAFDLFADVEAAINRLPGVHGAVTVYDAALQAPRFYPHPTRNYPRFVAAGTLSARRVGT